jgi:hypothetical protein
LVWTGTGWHQLYQSGGLSLPTKAACFSTCYGDNRLWFGADDEIKYMLIPEGVYNPLDDGSAQFEPVGELQTAWFDGGFTELSKIAVSVMVRARNLSDYQGAAQAQPYIDVYYGFNDEAGETLLGRVTTDSATLAFAGGKGKEFRNIRFTFKLGVVNATGTHPADYATTSPALLFANLRYLKIPTITWGWGFRVDATQPYHGRSTDEQIRQLKLLSDMYEVDATERTLLTFAFRNGEGQEELHYVARTGVSAKEWTGNEERAVYDITIVEP